MPIEYSFRLPYISVVLRLLLFEFCNIEEKCVSVLEETLMQQETQQDEKNRAAAHAAM